MLTLPAAWVRPPSTCLRHSRWDPKEVGSIIQEKWLLTTSKKAKKSHERYAVYSVVKTDSQPNSKQHIYIKNKTFTHMTFLKKEELATTCKRTIKVGIREKGWIWQLSLTFAATICIEKFHFKEWKIIKELPIHSFKSEHLLCARYYTSNWVTKLQRQIRMYCVLQNQVGGCKDTGDLSATEREQKHGYRREERWDKFRQY